jgi:hypothetical protein
MCAKTRIAGFTNTKLKTTAREFNKKQFSVKTMIGGSLIMKSLVQTHYHIIFTFNLSKLKCTSYFTTAGRPALISDVVAIKKKKNKLSVIPLL